MDHVLGCERPNSAHVTWEKCLHTDYFQRLMNSVSQSVVLWFSIVLLIIQSLIYLSSQLRQKDLINLGCIRTWLLWSPSLLNPSPTAQSLLKNYIEVFGIVFTFPWPSGYFSLLLAAVADTIGCLSSSHYSFSLLRLKIPDIVFPPSFAVWMCIPIIYCHNNVVWWTSLNLSGLIQWAFI